MSERGEWASERTPGVQAVPGAYTVLTEPALLAGMPRSGVGSMRELHAAGFRHVVRLEDDLGPYDPAPLGLVHVPLTDLHEGSLPPHPARERELVIEAVDAVLARLRLGEGVVVHCIGGIGRTGTVLGGVLVRLGWPPDEVIARLDAIHAARGRHGGWAGGWPESPWQSEMVRSLAGDLAG